MTGYLTRIRTSTDVSGSTATIEHVRGFGRSAFGQARLKHVLIVVFLILTASAQPALALGEATARHRPPIIQQFGQPTWEPVDFNLFSAPIGTAESGYTEFSETNLKLLPLHAAHPQLGVGPGTPHKPPYDHELADGVRRARYARNGPFSPEQFSSGKGVFLVWMAVPSDHARTFGSSPDFARGPIIQNALFPIHVEGVSYRNNVVFDSALAGFDVPALNDPKLTPSFAVDGASHFPVFIADNADFGPSGAKLPGSYTYRVTMRDARGNGWSISASFTIKRFDES